MQASYLMPRVASWQYLSQRPARNWEPHSSKLGYNIVENHNWADMHIVKFENIRINEGDFWRMVLLTGLNWILEVSL